MNTFEPRLTPVATVLRQLFPDRKDDIHLEPTRLVRGWFRYAGSAHPAPSSAARIRIGSSFRWIPAPDPEHSRADDPAAFFRIGGAMHVLPVVRLCVVAYPSAELETIQYLPLGDWLAEALNRWKFPRLHGSGEDAEKHVSLMDALSLRKPGDKLVPERVLDAVAHVVSYAIIGSNGAPSFDLANQAGIMLPKRGTWLRPVEDTDFVRGVARLSVVTARLLQDVADAAQNEDSPGPGKEELEESGDSEAESEETTSADKKKGKQPRFDGIPTTEVSARGYRIHPSCASDWGIDPVHTPENQRIRLTAHLGQGVLITKGEKKDEKKGELLWKSEQPPQSSSTARIPYAEFDDPRRLLMAANMQTHAMELVQSERPLVRTDDVGLDPPGVNLRVGYIAWRGLNHEDAWVLSKSAALKFRSEPTWTQTIAIHAVEQPPEILVKTGDEVRTGQKLLRRRLAPGYLAINRYALGADELIELAPDLEDRARHAGIIVDIDVEDLVKALSSGVAGDDAALEELGSRYRCVVKVTLRRSLPLEVGDKLANRHGHKGIVGAILDDNAMPCWKGQPLEALIDPISILNRSNWGQALEGLAGALVDPQKRIISPDWPRSKLLEEVVAKGANSCGQWALELPADQHGSERRVDGLAGVQFVMRLPHHAQDRISVAHSPGRRIKEKPQRFGEMDHWALWAHGIQAPRDETTQPESDTLFTGQSPLSLLCRLLALAGYQITLTKASLAITRLQFDQRPLAQFAQLLCQPAADTNDDGPNVGDAPVKKRRTAQSCRELQEAMQDVRRDAPTALVFVPPILGKNGPIRWLPILPMEDRPERRRTGQAHPLTLAYNRIVRLHFDVHRQADINPRSATSKRKKPAKEDQVRWLGSALNQLLYLARRLAIGTQGFGVGSHKLSLLRRQVLGFRVPRSGRAVISPAAPLSLDEIGIPHAMLEGLFEPGVDPVGKSVWVKRDPVLHRWGLLQLRVQPISGNTIQMSASLLGPLGADFDGDTVAVFAELPGVSTDDNEAAEACRPSRLAWDPLLNAPTFKPGKQYLYGLHLLGNKPERMRRFQDDLQSAGAPAWPDSQELGARDRLTGWLKGVGERQKPDGAWWRILEEHALSALEDDPSMGVGISSIDELAMLPVVLCGASKFDAGEKARPVLEAIVGGESLKAFQKPSGKLHPDSIDLIDLVMVAAKCDVGRFGGALRRILLKIGVLDAEVIRNAQCLTEQVTQKVLSIKAGREPMTFSDYDRQLRRLLTMCPVEPAEEIESPDMREIVTKLSGVWDKLLKAICAEPASWLAWLCEPHRLDERLNAGSPLIVPLTDLRSLAFAHFLPPKSPVPS